jgi:hypothetical protein
VEAKVQALLEAVNSPPPLEKIRSCDIQKWMDSLHWERPAELMAFQMNASGTFQEGHWYTWHIYLIIDSGCPVFQSLGRKQKSQRYRNPVRTQNSLKIYVRLASCPQQAIYSKNSFWK